MYQLIVTNRFERQLSQFQRAHSALRRRIAQTLIDLEQDPFQPRLRLHALSGPLAGSDLAT